MFLVYYVVIPKVKKTIYINEKVLDYLDLIVLNDVEVEEI